ncbi:GERMIN-LIKE PROTEIN [Salix purpurea]|uniref:Germin-like protein n=1 Tax=Salix purpurea TaxID=77065 RepID=A0A9Q0X0N6_SALPP|nr:GERMIN-LIKE PROTEIN [Salix purpurea]
MAANKAAYLSLLYMALGLVLLAIVSADPDLLQDVCVADLSSGVKVNGFTCKENISAEDFFFVGLAKPGLTNNTFGSLVTAANVQKDPRTQHLGGQLDVGFITTANVLISKTIKVGETFVFPKGLVHFQKNNGQVPAAVIAAFNSQLPGTQSIAATLFSAQPPVPDHVLTMAFQVGTKEVRKIKSRFAPKK